MYYEECVLGGILHYRTSLEGEWISLPREMMTSIIIQLRRDIQQHCKQMETLINQLH
jgi:hypothetical protein